MSVVLVEVIKELEDSAEPWLQVVDDVNESNKKVIEMFITRSNAVVEGNFSDPVTINHKDELSLVSSSMLGVFIDELENLCKKLEYSETQAYNFKLKGVTWMRFDFQQIVTCLYKKQPDIVLTVKSDNVKKHEWYYLQLLNKLGVRILLITKDIDSLISYKMVYANIKTNIVRCGTSENVNIDRHQSVQPGLVSMILDEQMNSNNTVDHLQNLYLMGIGENQVDTSTQGKLDLQELCSTGLSGRPFNASKLKALKKSYDNSAKEIMNLKGCECDYTEILDALTSHSKIVKASICGCRDDFDTPMLAAKCLEASKKDDRLVFFDGKIHKPSVIETSKVYDINLRNFKKNKIDWVINTIKWSIEVPDDEKLEREIRSSLVTELYRIMNTGNYTDSIIYNKTVTLICWINKYIKDGNTEIVFYGNPKASEDLFLRVVLGTRTLSCLVLTSDINNSFGKDMGDLYIELNKTKDIVPLAEISADRAETLAYSASKKLDDTLYAGDTIGLYKNGQINYCDTIHLACTFAEIPLWWNREMYIRPGFKKEGSKAIIPIQFNLIKGTENENSFDYKRMVQTYACGKTMIYYSPNIVKQPCNSGDGPFIHNCTDIKGTSFSEQQPYILGGKLQTEFIKGSRNYKYKFLDVYKQDFILSKIQEIIDDPKIIVPKQYLSTEMQLIKTGTPFTSEYIDALLNMTLNLDIDTLRTIQWFNYTDYNPNIIVILENEESMTFMDAVYLRFMSKLGFDVMIFVPTSYTSIEQYIAPTEYETYNLGRPIYDLNIGTINVKADAEYAQKAVEKKGLFSKLFSK